MKDLKRIFEITSLVRLLNPIFATPSNAASLGGAQASPQQIFSILAVEEERAQICQELDGLLQLPAAEIHLSFGAGLQIDKTYP